MTRACEITGRGTRVKILSSHANNKTRSKARINLQTVHVTSAIIGRTLGLRVSTNGIKTLAKYQSFDNFLINGKICSDKLVSLKRQLLKKMNNTTV